VLFAATMAEVFRRFKNFGADHMLMDVVPRSDKPVSISSPSDRRDPAAGSADCRITHATSLIRALDEMNKSKVLEGIDVTVLKLDVLNKLISNVMEDPGP